MEDKVLKRLIVFNLCLLISSNCFSYERTISFMTYNLENLFDTLHDEGKEDYTFLPLIRKERDPEIRSFCYKIPNPKYRNECFNLDWSAPVLLNKIRNLSKIIKQSNRGRGPDLIVFQEVENYNSLQKLINLGLEGEGYEELVIVEGPDKRGIDVAIVSRFPLAKDVRYHQINLNDAFPNILEIEGIKKTRGILEATFSIKGKLLSIFANHWPSQANPNVTRMIAAETLSNVIRNHPNPYIVAGDFNTEKNDRQNGIREILMDPSSTDALIDAEGEYNLLENNVSNFNKGTHFYRGRWNSLDKILLPKRFIKGFCKKRHCLRPFWDSFEIVYEDFMLEGISYEDDGEIIFEKIPKRFDPETGLGASDHLPVLLRFSL
jgi:endonuclease/exonuclease/phosphatase family metal-dependent hydrolase